MTGIEAREIMDHQVRLLAEASKEANAEELCALSNVIFTYLLSGSIEDYP